MEDKEKIIEELVYKYGYKRNVQPSVYPKRVNNRIRKALEHFLLFYDKDKEKLRVKIIDQENNIKFMFEFIQKKGFEQEYKKKCLKDLII